MSLHEKRINRYINSSRNVYEKLLGELVGIPTVSADPLCKKEIQRGAAWAVKTMKRFGLRSERVNTPGHPVVIGTMGDHQTDPTVLIYNHLDVQPADPSEWTKHPFQMSITNGRYQGRGTTDDKGPALTALFAAQYAREQGIPLSFRFVWEFEEEIGSPHFEKAIRLKKKDLNADSVVVSDTVWVSRTRPAIPYGIRGLVTAVLKLETGKRDAHSGLVGGAARNPIGELCSLLGKCYEPSSGRVKIPGFYDDALKAGKKEIQGFLESGFKISEFCRAHGLKKIRFNETRKVLDAIWSRPTFEIHGIKGGYTGEGVKTIVPPAAEAKVSMRLVPRQDPKKIFTLFKFFVQSHHPEVQVSCEATLDPYLSSVNGTYLQAASDAMKYGFKIVPARVREGGSIGAVVSLNRVFNAPVIFLGLSLPEHGYHAPNEYFEWKQVQGGIRSFVHYFDQISRIR